MLRVGTYGKVKYGSNMEKKNNKEEGRLVKWNYTVNFMLLVKWYNNSR